MTSELVNYLPEETLIQKAVEALIQALGPVEATRFLSLTHENRLDSVTRHQEWQSTLEKETFFDQVFNKQN